MDVGRFFVLTYAASWGCFGLALAFPAVRQPVFLLGVFAPALVALALTARRDGRPGVDALLGRLALWNVGARWYVFAVGFFVAVKLAVALTTFALTRAWPPFGPEPWAVIAAAIVLSWPVQAGEELGWRGYALPRLGATLGLGPGSVVLGIVWATWHLPTFFFAGAGESYGASFPLYVAGVTALSVAIGWLFAHTNGSVLLAMLMHSAVNQVHAVIGGRLAAPLTVAVLWIAAAYFLVRMPTRRPSATKGSAPA